MSVSKPSRQSSVRSFKYDRSHTFNMAVDLSSLDDLLDDLGDKVEEATRPAAQAAAEVFYQAVIKNVEAIGSVTGNLKAAIYQKYMDNLSGDGKAVYTVSWRTAKGSLPRAPHGHLIEYGHIQRYAVRIGTDGKWHTLVRPSMRGKPKPGKYATQAERDAYYVLRKGGPVQIAAQPFIRPAFYKQGDAVLAARKVLLDAVGAK